MNNQQMIPIEQISGKILLIRAQKVLLDRDLAKLYGIETKYLKRAVRRNIERFPGDFMFEMNDEELNNWRCQIDTSNSTKMGLRYKPMVFTEQGVAMLSSVLHSKKAIEINILIMRAFVRMRELLYSDKNLSLKIEKLEQEMNKQGKSLNQVIKIVTKLLKQPKPKPKEIGFRIDKSINNKKTKEAR
ncbi:MAG: ORF6N domain-containing protein [Candidatus Cloacimonetes bacterium]|nr:ORF6N domain-containing protein [Candidatus Cloacimonadota bacterium]